MAQQINVLQPCQVTMLTFGGKKVFTIQQKEFIYGSILTQNEHYTVFQNGLNYYVFPTIALDMGSVKEVA